MFKLPGLVAQLVPSYSSVAAVVGGVIPPKANAAVCIPAAPEYCLAVFKELLFVQEVPLYSSVAPVAVGVATYPPKAKPAV